MRIISEISGRKSCDGKGCRGKIRYKQEQRINLSLYEDVKAVLDVNKSERHIRGGEATKKKYLEKKGKINDFGCARENDCSGL